MDIKLCSVEGCQVRSRRRGWCAKHYARWKRCGDPNKVLNEINIGKKCSALVCKKNATTKGFCGAHYITWGRYGDPLTRNQNLGKERNNTKKATKSPTLLEIAWAAGFYEGEGNCRANGKFKSGKLRSASVHIYQRDIEPLEKMLVLFGGRICKTKRNNNRRLGINTKDGHSWYLSGSRARGFAMTMYVFLTTRRKLQIRKTLGIK